MFNKSLIAAAGLVAGMATGAGQQADAVAFPIVLNGMFCYSDAACTPGSSATWTLNQGGTWSDNFAYTGSWKYFPAASAIVWVYDAAPNSVYYGWRSGGSFTGSQGNSSGARGNWNATY